ncbi:MAG: GDP-mannose 4,6-dehydratase [Pseudomonadota bacterium]
MARAKTAFITGITGQDGAYLAQLLLEKGYHVAGGARLCQLSQVSRSSGGKRPGNARPAPLDPATLDRAQTARLWALGIARQVALYPLDLTRGEDLRRLLDALAPDEIYNLGAESHVGSSWDAPVRAGDINALGVARLLEVLRKEGAQARLFQASSSEIFGPPAPRAEPPTTPETYPETHPESPAEKGPRRSEPREILLSETSPVAPRSPYGIAKAYGHFITSGYRMSHGLHASSGILFNHESPLRGESFVTRKITRALAAIARGGQTPCLLGNLAARRDWGFAGDYVAAMWRMLQEPAGGDYVLATGVTTSIRGFIGHAAAALGLDLAWEGAGLEERAIDRASGRLVIAVSPAFFRPSDPAVLCGDGGKARARLGWQPRIDVTALAEMMVRADYDALGAGAMARDFGGGTGPHTGPHTGLHWSGQRKAPCAKDHASRSGARHDRAA